MDRILQPIGLLRAARFNLSVAAKFGAIVGLSTATVMALAVCVIGARIRAEDVAQSQANAQAAATRISRSVQTVFENAVDVVSNTNDALVSLQDEGIRDPAAYDATMKRLIESGGDRYGAWLIWDGSDAPFDIGSQKSRFDKQGRFATYWHQNGMEMLRDAVPAEITDSDLFQIPRTKDQAYLLEPHFIFATDGDPTLVTSFAKPLEHDGKVVGVLAIDLKLEALRDALSSILLPEGASINVVSDSGIIAMSSTSGLVGEKARKRRGITDPAF